MSRGPTRPRLALLALVAVLLATAPVTHASPFLETLSHGVLAKLDAAWNPVLTWLRRWLDKDGESPEEELPPATPNACAGGDCTDDGWGADPDG